MIYQVSDWEDAYANSPHIPGGEDYIDRWQRQAAAFRATARHQPLSAEGVQARGDLFLPQGDPRGLVLFIHGGYWRRFAPSFWSHLAAGPLARGWAVAIPAYTLAPQARIAQMTPEIAEAVIQAAGRIAGPIALTGHSAGGHLAARMICDDRTLPDAVAARITLCLPISGLFDLRPLQRLELNDTLRIDPAEAAAESPALLVPRAGIPLIAWVGGAERPEFIRQSRLLANIWAGLGAATDCVIDPGRHHFDVIEGLERADSPLLDRLLVRR